MALVVLEYYHDQGLWVVEEMSDGKFKVVQSKLSDEQYFQAKGRLEELDDDGYSEEDRRKLD